MSATAIRLGSLVDGSKDPAARALALMARGFESVELEFWRELGSVDLGRLAASFAAAREAGLGVSSLGVYGNSLDPAGPTLAAVASLVAAAPSFGAPIVSCFAGRLPGASVPDSLEAWKSAFGPLAEAAAARGVAIAFENCRLGDTWKTGKWNIAINPDAWELMFDALPGAPIGLEWEPAHQLLSLADPLAQLRAWAPRVIHVHGKDARIDREALALKGFFAAGRIGRECLPGEGDTDWAEVFGALVRSGFEGSVDIEIPAGEEPGGASRDLSLDAALDCLRRARGD